MNQLGLSDPIGRRRFLVGAASGLVAGGVAGVGGFALYDRFLRPADYIRKKFTGKCVEVPNPAFALPGRYPGRVVEVRHSGSVSSGKIDRQVVRPMVSRGITELTGAPDATAAWRSLFQSGDRVGIKVNPVGRPREAGQVGSISSFEVILEVVEGLRSAGLADSDIILFERYADEFREAGYEKFLNSELPDVQWYASAVRGGNVQIDLEGRDPDRKGARPDPDQHVLGYDSGVFRRFDYTMPQYDPSEGLSFQSHLSKIISGDLVNKIINIPTLKDHASAGVTLALKNLSHGLVSNVARTHVEKVREGNRCGTFIPRIVEMETIRRKTVLNIVDGLIGVYEGGPGPWKKSFGTWEYKALLFATDPVAMDHVGWDILDAERASRRWARVAAMGLNERDPMGAERFFIRQPEHIPLAGFLDLGIFEPAKIEHRHVVLA